MPKIEFNVFIKRSPQEIFDFMANPENELKWQKGLISSDPSRPGQRNGSLPDSES